MRWWAFSILGGLALGAVACSRPSTPRAAPEPASTTPGQSVPVAEPAPDASSSAADLTLIWTRDKSKRITTHFVEPSGKETGRAGLFIAVGSSLLRWSSKTTKQKAERCPAGNQNPYQEYTLETVSLAAVEPPGDSLTLLPTVAAREAQAKSPREIARDEYSAVASLGPLLFTRGDSAFWPCGMHPQYGAWFYPFEIGSDGKATPVDEARLFADSSAGLGEAIRLLNANASNDPDSLNGVALEGDVSPSLAFPSFAASGLRFSVQYTTTASWAGSFGGWSGYTRSVVVELPSAPAKLRPFIPLAERAAEYLRAHPGEDVGGVSRGAVKVPDAPP